MHGLSICKVNRLSLCKHSASVSTLQVLVDKGVQQNLHKTESSTGTKAMLVIGRYDLFRVGLQS